MSQLSDKTLPVARESQDDIAQLERAFSLQNWRYVDIDRQERLAGILNRWPLLAEWAAESQPEVS
ncbi:cellulose biosynthesis protein BcsR [Kalamiella sp. sgz302252]|uniref:cellulose biosynthesis protein BcsR n=1 Tax=Pantoea sp. sgz302252 TaxID=3341827 RepID=UPI0036D3A072